MRRTNSQTYNRSRAFNGRYMAERTDLEMQLQHKRDMENHAPQIEAIRFENAKQSLNAARLERIEKIWDLEERANDNFLMTPDRLATKRTEYATERDNYHAAAVALSRQVVKHLPR